jgi:hypothetical protein
MAVLFDFTDSNPSVASAGFDRPVNEVWVEMDLDLDATGQILLLKFPDVAFLRNSVGEVGIYFVDDGDTGATLAWDLDITDSDGVSDYALIAASTKGRAANETAESALVEAAGAGAYIDVGGKYLSLDITGVGTNTACTTQVRARYTQNVIKQAQTV